MKVLPAIPKAWFLYTIVGLMWLGYVSLLISTRLTADNSSPHLNPTEVNLIRLTFTLPILLVWIVSAQATVRFVRYAKLVAADREGPAIKLIATGFTWLFGYVVMLLMAARVVNLFRHSSLLYPAVFVKNHLPVLILLVACVYLYRGANRLLALAKPAEVPDRTTLVWLAYICFVCIYVAVFFTSPNRSLSADGMPLFAVSRPVLLFTLVIPSVVAWGLGTISAVNLVRYSYHVRGTIYKAALRWLAAGMGASLTFAMAAELIILNTSSLQSLGFSTILIIVYVLLAAYGLGAGFIAQGAQRLARIEVAL